MTVELSISYRDSTYAATTVALSIVGSSILYTVEVSESRGVSAYAMVNAVVEKRANTNTNNSVIFVFVINFNSFNILLFIRIFQATITNKKNNIILPKLVNLDDVTPS